MPKLMRGLVLGAMLVVLGSATAAVANEPPVGSEDAVQRFRAGERAMLERSTSDETATLSPAETSLRDSYQVFRDAQQPVDRHPVQPAASSAQHDTPVALLAALGAAAVLSLSLDAIFARRKARKATAAI
jgi:hypothetical protein